MRLSNKSKNYAVNSDELDDEFELTLDGVEIARVDEYKYFGFIMKSKADQ